MVLFPKCHMVLENLPEFLKLKTQLILSAGEAVEQLELLNANGGSANWYNLIGKLWVNIY